MAWRQLPGWSADCVEPYGETFLKCKGCNSLTVYIIQASPKPFSSCTHSLTCINIILKNFPSLLLQTWNPSRTKIIREFSNDRSIVYHKYNTTKTPIETALNLPLQILPLKIPIDSWDWGSLINQQGHNNPSPVIFWMGPVTLKNCGPVHHSTRMAILSFYYHILTNKT